MKSLPCRAPEWPQAFAATRSLVEPAVPAECTSRVNYVFNQTASTGKTFAQNVDIDILR